MFYTSTECVCVCRWFSFKTTSALSAYIRASCGYMYIVYAYYFSSFSFAFLRSKITIHAIEAKGISFGDLSKRLFPAMQWYCGAASCAARSGYILSSSFQLVKTTEVKGYTGWPLTARSDCSQWHYRLQCIAACYLILHNHKPSTTNQQFHCVC